MLNEGALQSQISLFLNKYRTQISEYTLNIYNIQFEIILADHNKINDLRDVYQFAKNEFDFRELFGAVWAK